MKMRRGYFAVILLAGLLSACGTGGSEDAALTPTGYPSGEEQQTTVYYNGTRYWYTAQGFDQPLEDGFEKVGEVGRVDNQEYPEEEFGGTRLDGGQEIYASREDVSKIYVKYDSGYAVFERQDAATENVITNEDTETGSKSLPPITADAHLINPASASFSMERTECDIVAFADLNHDGKPERVVFGLEEYAESGGMECGALKVLNGMDENAPVLWSEDYGTVHSGWNMLYLYREDGRDYLVRYSPYMNTGLGEFQLHIFSLDERGEPVTFKNCETGFSITIPDTGIEGFYGDTEEMVNFLEQAEYYLYHSLLLVSTDEGELAYSTPETPITLQHSHMEWCSGWNVTNSENALEIFRLAAEKNWLETEGIRILCGITEGWQTFNIDLSIKGNRRESIEIDDMMQNLFGVLSEDNWIYLPKREMPQETPDVLITISRVPACDMYISCFAEKELAVIWSAPFVTDIDNHMEAICECYQLSKAVIEEIMR